MKTFDIGEALRASWNIVRANLLFLIVVSVILFLVNYVPGFVGSMLAESDLMVVSVAIQIVGVLISIITSIGIIKITLNLIDRKKSEYVDLFNHYPLFFPYLGVSLLTGLIVFAGFLLLIIPGIILAIRLQFAPYVLIDQRKGIVDSLYESWKITQGNFWRLVLFGLVLAILNIAGFLAFMIGLLITIPITMISIAYIYRKLEGKHASKS